MIYVENPQYTTISTMRQRKKLQAQNDRTELSMDVLLGCYLKPQFQPRTPKPNSLISISFEAFRASMFYLPFLLRFTLFSSLLSHSATELCLSHNHHFVCSLLFFLASHSLSHARSLLYSHGVEPFGSGLERRDCTLCSTDCFS